MWRYRRLLGVGEGPIRYPLAIGGTPLVAPPALRAGLRLPELWLKDETRGPSGSNKDRATALVLEQALRDGAPGVTAASMGNVAVSVAVGAAAAGLPATIFLPADVDERKLRLVLAAGATVVKVREGYERAFELSRRLAAERGWADRNTGVNPATVAAKATVAYEVFEELGAPDVAVAPVGDGVTLAALARGFRHLVEAGVTNRVPRLVGVQAEGAQPVVRAFECGGRIEASAAETVADGIRVGAPVFGVEALEEVRRSGGAMLAVSDARILEAAVLLAQRAGVLAEPAGAAATAGLWVALELGLVTSDETVVVLVTGTGLKTPGLLPAGGTVADA